MTFARLKTEIQAQALIRRCAALGVSAAVMHKGDPDAGAMLVKVYHLDRTARLFVSARTPDGEAAWRAIVARPAPERDVEARIARERDVDPDIWAIEIEDPEGDRHFAEPLIE